MDLCCKSDTRLFKSITSDSDHILQSLLPAKIVNKYSLGKRAHDYILPKRTTSLYDRNFMMRMLYGHSFMLFEPSDNLGTLFILFLVTCFSLLL